MHKIVTLKAFISNSSAFCINLCNCSVSAGHKLMFKLDHGIGIKKWNVLKLLNHYPHRSRGIRELGKKHIEGDYHHVLYWLQKRKNNPFLFFSLCKARNDCRMESTESKTVIIQFNSLVKGGSSSHTKAPHKSLSKMKQWSSVSKPLYRIEQVCNMWLFLSTVTL